MIRVWISALVVFLPLIASAASRSERLAPQRVGELFGFGTKSGRLVIPARFDMVTPFRDGRAAVLLNGHWGFIDGEGHWVGQPKYDWIHPAQFDGGPALVSANGLYGYVDRQGEHVIPMSLEQATPFVTGHACVWDPQAMLFGIVDAEGLPVTGFRFHECDPHYNNGLARVRKGRLWGYVDTDGAVALDFVYSQAEPFHEGLALVETQGLRFFMDSQGRKVIPANMPAVRSFREGRALIKLGANRVGFMNEQGQRVIVPSYEDARDFSHGVAWVKEPRGLWRLVDRRGVAMTKAVYRYPGTFSEGLCLAQRDAKFGFVDPNGAEVVPFQFESVGSFQGGMAMVSTDRGGKQGAVSVEGKLLVEELYNQVVPLVDGFAQVTSCGWERKGALGHEVQVCEVFYVDHQGRERR